MSVVAGYTNGDFVALVADALVMQDNGLTFDAGAIKVWHTGRAVIGSTGRVSMMNALREVAIPRRESKYTPIERYVAEQVVPEIRRTLGRLGVLTDEKDRQKLPNGGSILLGIEGRLFVIVDDFGLTEPGCRYAAVGSGASIATGALHSLAVPLRRAKNEAQITRLLERAARAAADHRGDVRGPFHAITGGRVGASLLP